MEIFIGQTKQSTATTGTHDNVSGDSGVTPLASLYAVSVNNSLGVVNNGIGHGLGLTDGVVEGSIGWGVNSGQATSVCSQIRRAVAVASCERSAQVVNGEHVHDSFIAGGNRVARTSNGFSNTWYANHMHFADCNAAVLEADLSAVVDTAVNIDPGFAWDLVICFSNDIGGASGQTADADFALGFYVLADDDQACMMWNSNNAQATPGDNSVHMSTIYAAGKTATGVGTIIYGVDISAGAGTSCDLTTRIAGGEGERVTCLFIGFTGTEIAKIIPWDSPIAAGEHSVTGHGILPTYGLIHLLSLAQAYNTAEADADGGAYGISFLTPFSEFCMAGADENGADPSDVQSTMVNQAIDMSLDDGTTGFIASFQAMIAGGFRQNFTDVDGTTRKNISLGIGEPISTGPLVPEVNENGPLQHGVNAMITGANFEAVQGTGSVIISPTDDINDLGAITQTISSWSDTVIEITGVVDTLIIGDSIFLFVTNDSADSNAAGHVVSFEANFELDFADDLSFQVTAQFSLVPPTEVSSQRFGQDGFLSGHSWFFGG